MKEDADLIDRVRAALRRVSDVTEKRMFGSTGFMIRGKLAIGARAERIMCRIDPSLQASMLERSGCRPVVMKGRTMNGYLYVDASALTTEKELKFWIQMVRQQNRVLTK
jgi:TfoX/Sxy family transcriptional regulator of competence genes